MEVMQVCSTFIAGIGYVEEFTWLRIVFKSGVYEDYSGLIKDDYYAIRAELGKVFNARIKNKIKPFAKGVWQFY